MRLLGAVPCAQQAAAERAVKLKFSVQLSIENLHFGDAFAGIDSRPAVSSSGYDRGNFLFFSTFRSPSNTLSLLMSNHE